MVVGEVVGWLVRWWGGWWGGWVGGALALGAVGWYGGVLVVGAAVVGMPPGEGGVAASWCCCAELT